MRAHWRYGKYVVRHKWFVFVAGLKTLAPLWRLVIHDWSKFLPCEWFPYVAKSSNGPSDEARRDSIRRERSVLGYEITKFPEEVQAAFDRAWLHHQHANPHHWQHWLLLNDSPDKYPKYCLTSADGGMVHHALTEYAKPYPVDRNPVQADFTNAALQDDGEDGTQQRYLMVRRMLAAANARRPVALPMPERFVREMVADWAGAGRAITGKWEVSAWYAKNRGDMVLHPDTRSLVESLLAQHFGG